MNYIDKAKEIVYMHMILDYGEIQQIPHNFLNPECNSVLHRNRPSLASKLTEVLVPSDGPADTIAGEILRAFQRVQYKFVNDNDTFCTGCPENIIPSILYIASFMPEDNSRRFFKDIKELISNMTDANEYGKKKLYNHFLKGLENDVETLIANDIWKQAFNHNSKDSRDLFSVDDKFNITEEGLYKKYCTKEGYGALSYPEDFWIGFSEWCEKQTDKWEVIWGDGIKDFKSTDAYKGGYSDLIVNHYVSGFALKQLGLERY